MGNLSWLEKPGEYIVYAHEFSAWTKEIARALRDGKITVIVDWNRTGWSTDEPENAIVYRVTVGSKA